MSDEDLRERKRAWESAPSRETERDYFGALARAGQLPEASEVRGRERWSELVTKLDSQLAEYLPEGLNVEERRGISRRELLSAIASGGNQAPIREAIQHASKVLDRELPRALTEAYLLLYSLPTFRYGNQDHICWPEFIEIDRSSERGPVAVFSHENQNVVQWGFWLDTADEDPEILLTFEDTHWRGTSVRIVESLTRHTSLSPIQEPALSRIHARIADCRLDSMGPDQPWPPSGLEIARPDCSQDFGEGSCPVCTPGTQAP